MTLVRRAARAAFDWDDFVQLPEDDRRELIDGRLVEIDVPRTWHERIVSLLIAALVPWARKRGLEVLASGYKVRVGRRRGVMPDVQVLTRAVFDAADESGLDDG